MKKIQSNIFAFAFLAMGTFAGLTSCDKEPTDGATADFEGTYYGSYSILGLLEVADTLIITNIDESNISIFSYKLDTSFTASISGSTANFNGFSAEKFTAGSVTMTGIKVGSGTGTLKNNTDLTVILKEVDVNDAEGESVPDFLKAKFPLTNQKITTEQTFKKQ